MPMARYTVGAMPAFIAPLQALWILHSALRPSGGNAAQQTVLIGLELVGALCMSGVAHSATALSRRTSAGGN